MKKLAILACALVALAAMPAAAANSLAVTPAAALQGSNYGLAVTNDFATHNDVYVSSQHPSDETIYRFSFRIFPGDLPAPTVESDYLIGFVRTNGGARPWSIPIYLRRQNEYWTLQTNTRQDNDQFPAWNFALKICGNENTVIPCSVYEWGGVQFEFEYHTATSPGASDGWMRVKKVGTAEMAMFSNLTNYTRTVTEIRWGAIFQGNSINRPTGAGTYHFDDFESYRTAAP